MGKEDAQVAMDGSPAVVTILGTKMARAVGAPVAVFGTIQFQCGPVGEVGVNGACIEDVIDVLTIRLNGFQAGPFKCRENALAITKLEEARMWLSERTRLRVEQGVEGKNVAHAGVS